MCVFFHKRLPLYDFIWDKVVSCYIAHILILFYRTNLIFVNHTLNMINCTAVCHAFEKMILNSYLNEKKVT